MPTAAPTTPTLWRLRDRVVRVDRPVVVGIVNVTPDSFSDGGRHLATDDAVAHAERLVAEGADLLDVGGESTRPGAEPVSADEECGRVLPVLRALRERHPTLPLMVDTVKSAVAVAALDAGADAVNDVSGGRLDDDMVRRVADRGAGYVVMHSRGTVADMARYDHAVYGDPAADALAELQASVDAALAAGVPAEAIVVDPGIGFAKRGEHSVTLLRALPTLASWGYPVLVGVSRKRFVGDLSGVVVPEQRVYGTVGANVAALALGARLFRVHDVAASRQALDVAWAVLHP
jgi:dihydropteroate synthase